MILATIPKTEFSKKKCSSVLVSVSRRLSVPGLCHLLCWLSHGVEQKFALSCLDLSVSLCQFQFLCWLTVSNWTRITGRSLSWNLILNNRHTTKTSKRQKFWNVSRVPVVFEALWQFRGKLPFSVSWECEKMILNWTEVFESLFIWQLFFVVVLSSWKANG